MANHKINLTHEENLENLINKIFSRNAILFLGSGFSASAAGLNSEEMPTAKILAKQIGDIGEPPFDAEEDLRYAASRYLEENKDPKILIKLLRENFTVREIHNHHKFIAKTPWRRVYTTNYDSCYERAAEQVGKIIHTVDLSAHPSDYQADNNICLHINGSLKNLSEKTLETSFKLSNSSYLTSDSFIDSSWFYTFKRDLDFSSAIVFVGYSMYDIELQKILHSSPEYSKKTYFITQPIKSAKTRFILEQFGKIFPIGCENFGTAIEKARAEFEDPQIEFEPIDLWEYKIDDAPPEIRDSNVDAFLMHGDLSDSLIDAALTDTKGAPLLVPREELLQAAAMIEAGSRLVITSEFGNGKTTFLRMLRTILTLQGMRVFTADQKNDYQHEDLDLLAKRNIRACLMVDSYEQNIELIKHFAELNPPNLQLIISARSSIHNRHKNDLINNGLVLSEISVDELSPSEVDRFIEIIDNAGYWGQRAALKHDEKYEIISNDNQKQISSSLLSLLSSPQMVERVRNIISPLTQDQRKKDTIFALSLLSALDMPMNFSLISDIALNDEIYKVELRSHDGFRQIFGTKGARIWPKSSIFAVTLISHQFPSAYVVDQLLKIVAAIENENSGAIEKREIRKNLLRFSVVERLLPSKQRIQNLVRYYENLKREVQWLKSDPHFWLQYGMAQLTYKEVDKAQTYFDQAYAFAAKKENYHTHPIDTQQARLFLHKSTQAFDPALSFKLFLEAHQLLSRVPEDIHKYRQVELYKDVYDKYFSLFSKQNKNSFRRACASTLKKLSLTISRDESLANNKRIRRIKSELEKMSLE